MPDRDFEADLLYFGHGYTAGTTLHSHPYFQLEYCLEGHLPYFDGTHTLILDPGVYMLIPPEGMHKFRKTVSSLNYISIKFTSPFVTGLLTGNDPVCRYFLDKIREVIDGETGFNAYSPEGKCIIENLLSGILRRLDRTAETVAKSGFLTELQTLIYDSGAASNISELSEKFRMTRAEFKYRFQQETGSGRVKEYMDSVLLKIIEQHLRYSDISLNSIARQLHFSSIYAFSRYYKHHRGITPSEFRRRENRSPE